MNFYIPSIWWIIGSSIALILYVLFWLIQFFGVTQVEQSSYMFERLSYEISSNQIMMKINNKQGMPIKWDTVRKVKIQKDCFLFKLNIVQFIIFPYKVFNNENEIRFINAFQKKHDEKTLFKQDEKTCTENEANCVQIKNEH